MEIGKTLVSVVGGSSLGVAASVAVLAVMPTAVEAQAGPWAVWENCRNGRPCTIGVAPKSYAPFGSANHKAGWYVKSQYYKNSDDAWRTACRWHYGGNTSVTSPDISSGRFNCRTVCNNGTCR